MRKTIAVLLVAGCALVSGRTMAADRAGISLEWGMGPTLVLGGGFSMLMDEQAGLAWNVSDDFAVSVFTGNGMWRGEYEYQNNATPAIKHKISVEGSRDLMGIGINHSLPGLSFLKIGLELGIMNLGEDRVRYNNSDGTYDANDVNFGPAVGAREAMNAVASMEGISAKITLLKGESKGTYADIAVMGSLRFVQIPSTRLYGTQEFDSTASPKKAIDPIESFNNLSIKLVASLGF